MTTPRFSAVVGPGAIAEAADDIELVDSGSDASAARGEWVVFLDRGDELLPDALRRAVETTDRDAVLAGWIAVSADVREWRTVPAHDAAQGVWIVRRSALAGTVLRVPVDTRNLTTATIPEAVVVRYASPPAAPRRTVELGAIHGVLVTFDRPASLATMVGQLRAEGVDTLTVVDNAPSAPSRAAALSASTELPTHYIEMAENTGAAGGIAVGMQHVLRAAADDDVILLLDDDELSGEPGDVRRLYSFASWLLARGAPVGSVGLVGSRFDRRTGRLVRLGDHELAGPASVDYVAGGQVDMILVRAARRVGTHDRELFFGFDDLDYAMRLARAGFGIYVDGPLLLTARERHGRTGAAPAGYARRLSVWRRYYAVRNRIVVMRRYTTRRAAARVTLEELFGRPVQDLRRRRPGARAFAVAGLRGAFDAWSGRLGRRVEP